MYLRKSTLIKICLVDIKKKDIVHFMTKTDIFTLDFSKLLTSTLRQYRVDILQTTLISLYSTDPVLYVIGVTSVNVWPRQQTDRKYGKSF
jgi:hypothetical protein